MVKYFVIWCEQPKLCTFVAEPYDDINRAIARRDWINKNLELKAEVYSKTYGPES